MSERLSHQKVWGISNYQRLATHCGTDWGSVTMEEALDPARDDFYVYFASKLLAERALWQFVKQHPQLDVVTGKPCCTSPSLRHF
jgi:hypothetical protein